MGELKFHFIQFYGSISETIYSNYLLSESLNHAFHSKNILNQLSARFPHANSYIIAKIQIGLVERGNKWISTLHVTKIMKAKNILSSPFIGNEWLILIDFYKCLVTFFSFIFVKSQALKGITSTERRLYSTKAKEITFTTFLDLWPQLRGNE